MQGPPKFSYSFGVIRLQSRDMEERIIEANRDKNLLNPAPRVGIP